MKAVVYLVLTFLVCGRCVGKSVHDKASSSPASIVEEPDCEEVKQLCGHLSENTDFLVLECLQSLDPPSLSKINKNCQHIIWTHTEALINNENVKKILSTPCRSDLELSKCQTDTSTGGYLKCVANNKEDISNERCISLILRLENIAFSDYRWIDSFLEDCKEDIDNLQCGRIDPHSFGQSKTLLCLQNHHQNIIKDACKKEILRLSEIQADNIKLDHQLYSDCAQDHQRYCEQFEPGSGRVFSCLLQLRQEKISPQCKSSLLRRQKLIAQDYRISRGFMRACKEDIKRTHCRRQVSDDKNIRLAQILLCLENAAKNGTGLDPECEVEMMDHRKMLMEDFRLSPEIVDGCKDEIDRFCKGIGSKTIHCLMDHARFRNHNRKIGDTCRRSLERLVKESDVGEDWRVDPVLHEACTPVVRNLCHDVRGGNARVLSCLMDNIGADAMTEECEDALIQIQYFIARDFKLDPQLYNACRVDAVRLCHADQSWEDRTHSDPSTGPLVLPCLYRYAYHKEKKLQLNRTCLEQIRRVMRQRAISVDLIPEIEEVCLGDLALHCFDKTQRHEEMQCLQKNLDSLNRECQEALSKFTEMEAANVELNPYLMKNCKRVLETYCSNEMKNDEGSAMECLISHKNNPDVRKDAACRTSIEHVQIISLKDYRFSYKFKVACRPYAERFCRNSKTKADVVACLSEKVTNDTVNGIRSDIHKECRQQLKAQLFQQRENIDFDPKLKAACDADIKKYCKDVEHESAQVLECLQSVQEKLTDNCENELFIVKKQEATFNTVDYALMTTCEGTIEQFCPQYDREHVLDCLKLHKDEKGFSKKCRLIVVHRIIEQNSNYQLNPSLQQNCKADIRKFCFNHIIDIKPGNDKNEPVIKCLKTAFRNSKLSDSCEKEMASILHDQASDISLNPLLRAVCKDELETICRQDEESDVEDAEECLKTALLNKKIQTPACQNEIAEMIQESQADIQVDPPLQKACSLDLLNYCSNIPQGNGRHIKCLQIVMNQNPKQLTSHCRNMLTKRLEMYKNAAQVAPVDFQQLYNQVVTSPAKHYFFLMMFMMVGFIFVTGMFCGRASRRHMLLKNK